MRSAVVVLLIAFAGAVAGCGGSSNASLTTTDSSTSTTTTQTSARASSGCETVANPMPPDPKILQPPRRLLDARKDYALTFDTSCGTFVVRLTQKTAPHTAASLVALAHKGYFDNTIILRIVRNWIIQGGDPTQTGAGQPGYSTIDKPPASTRYVRGTFAMAKSPLDAPGTAGSQFFVVTAHDAKLPPIYAVAGKVTRGMDVVERIGKLGNKRQVPTRIIVVKHVTVDEKPATSQG